MVSSARILQIKIILKSNPNAFMGTINRALPYLNGGNSGQFIRSSKGIQLKKRLRTTARTSGADPELPVFN
jgi:hypothetical protein